MQRDAQWHMIVSKPTITYSHAKHSQYHLYRELCVNITRGVRSDCRLQRHRQSLNSRIFLPNEHVRGVSIHLSF